jgi:hypothetical protein
MPSIHLATEDELSECVGRRLIDEIGGEIVVDLSFRKGGNGYLRTNLDKFCQIARRHPLMLITDLDSARCAPTLIREWSANSAMPGQLLFRVAVREIESWLLADRTAIAKLLGKKAKLKQSPDLLLDPKATLLRLALGAPKEIRNDLVKEQGAIASQGLGYNDRLCDFVRTEWSPERASNNSDSLHRARASLISLFA